MPIYHIERIIKETSADFFDGSHIIYVNAKIDKENTPLSRLMHDFKCPDPEKMYYYEIAERVKFIKESEGGKDKMCEIMEELNRKAAKEAAKKATKRTQNQNALKMLEIGKLSFEEISLYSGLSIDEVNELAKSKLS